MTFDLELTQLEESLWRAETRFDRSYMESVLADDFVEFGRSGRIFTRDESLGFSAQAIRAQLPLTDFAVHRVAGEAYLVTYISKVTAGHQVERTNRSSLWVRTTGGWSLRFHQGTPCGVNDGPR